MPTGRLSGYREPWLKTLTYTSWSVSHFTSGVPADLVDEQLQDKGIEPLTYLLKSLEIGQAFAADSKVIDAARRDSQVRESRDAPLVMGVPSYGVGEVCNPPQ